MIGYLEDLGFSPSCAGGLTFGISELEPTLGGFMFRFDSLLSFGCPVWE